MKKSLAVSLLYLFLFVFFAHITLAVFIFIVMTKYPLDVVMKYGSFIQLSTGVLILLALYFYTKGFNKEFKSTLRFNKPSKRYIGLSIVIGISLIFFAVSFREILKYIIENIKIFSISFNVTSGEKISIPTVFLFLPTILDAVILAPLYEEIIFRGIIFNKLKEGFSVKSTIIISSIFFTFAHMIPLNFLTLEHIYTIIISLILGYVVYKTNCIWNSIIIHMLYNLMVICVHSFNLGINIYLSFFTLILSIYIIYKAIKAYNPLVFAK